MKYKLLIGFLFSFILLQKTNAVTREEVQVRFYYTGKIWGYLKYFHPGLSECKVNWDSVLISKIDRIQSVSTNDSFNLIMHELITEAGSVPSPLTEPVVKADSLTVNLNTNWFYNTILDNSVSVLLDTIRSRFRPRNNCYVQLNSGSDPNNKGWLTFNGERLDYIAQEYPIQAVRLLYLFRYWNIIAYFNPNNLIMDQSWDSTLLQSVMPVSDALNALGYQKAMAHCMSKINDSHGSINTLTIQNYYGNYYPGIVLRYIENKFVVTKVFNHITKVKVGDIVLSIQGKTTDELRDSMKQFLAYSNEGYLNRLLCTQLIRNQTMGSITIELERNGEVETATIYSNLSASAYYDSTSTIFGNSYELIPACNCGYVNMGRLKQGEINAMYTEFKNLPLIIFDLRNYPNGTAWGISQWIMPNKVHYATLSLPDVTYPGTFLEYTKSEIGVDNNSDAYQGKVVILVDQQSLSQSEYSAMMLQKFPLSETIGSQTAGADGNITVLSPVMRPFYTSFSTLRVLYPDGYDTQRKGVRIDRIVKPTVKGILEGRDEVLEAVDPRIVTGLKKTNEASTFVLAYPNPASKHCTIDIAKVDQVEATNMIGESFKLEFSQLNSACKINLDLLQSGLYVMRIHSDKGFRYTKLEVR